MSATIEIASNSRLPAEITQSTAAGFVRHEVFKLHDFGIALEVRQNNFLNVELRQKFVAQFVGRVGAFDVGDD